MMEWNLKITFEEDDNGTIGDFIASLQKRIINDDGTYNAPNNIKIDKIIVTVEDNEGIPNGIFTFHDCLKLAEYT